MKNIIRKSPKGIFSCVVLILAYLAPSLIYAQCQRTISADVVALDQVFFWNRLGAVQPQGMIFALRRDVVDANGVSLTQGGQVTPGQVRLRSDKRPRPLALRMNVGDCLQINFQNLLAPIPKDDEQPATRTASVHVMGMQLADSIASDGSNVGTNPSSLASPGGTATYTFYAEREGTHLLYSAAATTGGEGDGGSLNSGLFGAVNVEPRGAEWYRSQATAADLQLATTGTTSDSHPIINYDAVYPSDHTNLSLRGRPILKMLQGNEIVHSDLTAIITGPNRGSFSEGSLAGRPYPSNPVYPSRNQPFREFTIIYHDEIGATQAFPIFEDPVFELTLHGVRDGFAINYGTAGAGAEIFANRFGVGPMWNCPECKYEEFFLTSWAVGDPAMVVDIPANTGCQQQNCSGNTGPKATKAFYADDPSNVYHSYLRDHVKFRILHGGSKEHHIHHLHAHQWMNTPDSDNGFYTDSQAIGPGSTFTMEIAHNGSGNRNQTVGDSIFHCHFYPHFAQGMWALWRSHDVFESGTVLDANGRPAAGSRALPDGEIAAGTPIPAVVPIPTLAMAPLPGAQVQIVNGQAQITGNGNPGYPFFVPGSAGHRPPHPPRDTVDDGGLPRHIITGGTFTEQHTRLNFEKILSTASAIQLAEDGTTTEQAAMNFHAQRTHSSFTPEGTQANFITNGQPAQSGAPYADPCIDDNGNVVGNPRLYKAAHIQMDVKVNKAGWHFPQSRFIALWGDVASTLAGTRPPEPFFIRANSNDCITYQHTSLIPSVYEQDDFQVRTPTDIMGQHIHLVKFDVTSSDGSGNGWNYEDGSFTPGEVIERINAINANGGNWTPIQGGPARPLTPRAHPFFGNLGAQTTVQRWYADNVLNNLGQDQTLRTVFTHDHFSPSTHQEAGLYAGLVVEPQGSTWRNPETGDSMYTRDDGGPTSWRADILTANQADSYREFLLMQDDHHMAYTADNKPINPAARDEDPIFGLVAATNCPGGVPLPCPQAIAAEDIGIMTVNYRNEPIPLRVRNPQTNTQATGDAGDLSKVYMSNLDRSDDALDVQPNFYPPLTQGVQPGDPFTPLMRVYENDKVQIRILVGANEEGHNFSIHGLAWLKDPSDINSGYRNSQIMGISEHFEFLYTIPPASTTANRTFADYLYKAGSSTDDLWNGLWGILRAYDGDLGLQNNLLPLPNNTQGRAPFSNAGNFNDVCPKTAPVRSYDITATTAQQALPDGTLIYNLRTNQGGQLHDPTAILYVRTGDLDSNGKLKPGVPIEPLILRANAGECIEVALKNNLPAQPPNLNGFFNLPMIVENFNANQVKPSNHAGLHPQLIYYDVAQSDGANVGFNPVQTVGSGGTITYRWYAGDISIDSAGNRIATPVEFGSINLMPSDPIKHPGKGAIGALIVEPQGSTWVEDSTSRAAATVTANNATFREFVVILQNAINLRYGDGSAVPNTADAEDPEDSGQKAINYRTEPMWKRMGFAPETPLNTTRTLDFTNALSNSRVSGDPATPVFAAISGTPVRFRVLHPGGNQRNNVFQIHGHTWEEEPYTNGSSVLGSNILSEWKASQGGIGPTSHFDFLLKNGAGGKFGIPGDYLYRDTASFQFDGGLWGIFRVTPPPPTTTIPVIIGGPFIGPGGTTTSAATTTVPETTTIPETITTTVPEETFTPLSTTATTAPATTTTTIAVIFLPEKVESSEPVPDISKSSPRLNPGEEIVRTVETITPVMPEIKLTQKSDGIIEISLSILPEGSTLSMMPIGELEEVAVLSGPKIEIDEDKGTIIFITPGEPIFKVIPVGFKVELTPAPLSFSDFRGVMEKSGIGIEKIEMFPDRMEIKGSGFVASVRPDFMVTQTHEPSGLKLNEQGNLVINYEGGKQQIFYPAIVNWKEFKDGIKSIPGLENIQVGLDGVVKLTFQGKDLRFKPDYFVTSVTSPPADIKFENLDPFTIRITFKDGRQQIVRIF